MDAFGDLTVREPFGNKVQDTALLIRQAFKPFVALGCATRSLKDSLGHLRVQRGLSSVDPPNRIH
jgi:hypothetical protein